MFQLGIHVKVKFRAFFIDFGTVEKAWTVSADTSGKINVLEIPNDSVGPGAKTILDKRGVLVQVW